jgi:tetratricopeptide (TPR) repeat protein
MSGGILNFARLYGAPAAVVAGATFLGLAGPWSATARAADESTTITVAEAIEDEADVAPAESEKSVVISADEAAAAAEEPLAEGPTTDSPNDSTTDSPADSPAEERLEPVAEGAEATDGSPTLAEEEDVEPTLADDYEDLTAEVAAASDEDVVIASDEPAAGDSVAGDELDAELADTHGEGEMFVRPETACFMGVTPGASTRQDVVDKLGPPAAKQANGSLRFRVEGFPLVEVRVDDEEVVELIRVQLFEPVSGQRLARKLGVDGIRPAKLLDARGKLFASLYPERGVSLVHRPEAGLALATDGLGPAAAEGDDEVYEIKVQPIDSAHFLLRCEQTPGREVIRRTTDLETAIALDGANVAARLQLSQLKLSVGDAVDAESLAAEAVELAPRNGACRLQWARTLKYLARYKEAVEQVRTVVESTHASPLERAEAQVQMGLLASLGSQEVQKDCLPLLNKGIAAADKLAASDDPAVRIPAELLLIDAHLAVADQIAAGKYANKQETVAKWIARASGIAEHMIGAGEADVSLRLQVAVAALAAGSKLDPPVNPELWVQEAEQAASDLQLAAIDLPARDQLNWQLGMAYYYATEIAHRRSQPDEALKYGQLAEATLVPASDARLDLPDTQYVLGRLYFQIGAVHAVHRQDHKTACQWYDRATESLLKPAPLTAQTSPAKHGDALVSMGVSYWHEGERDRAYELTKSGLDLVQQGVQQGLIDRKSLEVPQNNLAAMGRVLGREEISSPETQLVQAKPADKPAEKIAEKVAEKRAAKPAPTRVASNGKPGGKMQQNQRSSSGQRQRYADRRFDVDGNVRRR